MREQRLLRRRSTHRQKASPSFLVGFCGCLAASLCTPLLQAERPDWTGDGNVRFLVKVEATDLGGRDSDEMVARCAVDWQALLAEHDHTGQVDLASLQVHRYNLATGHAEGFTPFDTARTRFDRPCRFDDNVLPEVYPSRVGRPSNYEDGRPPLALRQRKGRLFNRELDSTAGHVVWVHTQQGQRPSHYAVYFKIVPQEAATDPSPAPWIGDVDVWRKQEGQPLGGLSHFAMATGDLNGDGLFDLIAGAEKGDLMWFPNRGTPGNPRFVGCRILTDEGGPIDVGWYSAPFLFDWDANGTVDVLVGTSSNVILWWKNVGTPTEPRLRYRGFVQADGGRLEVPQSPAPEVTAPLGGTIADSELKAGEAARQRDYYNRPWVGDLNADGLPDLLTGGYITGLIFYYQSVGRDPQGVPRLTFAGTIHADGKPLDTTWGASPTASDFDGDGDLDLVTGSWWWSGIADEPEPGQVEYLMYYENVGTPDAPSFQRRPFPRRGELPRGIVARAGIVDWNEDGLSDLLVSDIGGNVYKFLNVGTSDEPVWQTDQQSLTIPWGFVRGAYGITGSSADMDGDGKAELLAGQSFLAFDGPAYSPRIRRLGSVHMNGQPIQHPGLGYGDPYYFTSLRDWDRDGRGDLLWGNMQGNVFLHRGSGVPDPWSFEPGIKLKLITGEDLQVGPPLAASPQAATDFRTLQGSRIKFVADDFDGDGIDDLAITETYRNLWIFLNTRQGGTDTLKPGVHVGKLTHVNDAGASLSVVDWNRDGKPDVLTGGAAQRPGMLFVNQSHRGSPRFMPPRQACQLPYLFWGPHFRAIDWNGDGDQDLLIRSEFYALWAERSFIDRGYRSGRISTRWETR